MKNTLILIAAAVLCASTGANAQNMPPQGGFPGGDFPPPPPGMFGEDGQAKMPKMKSPDEIAKKKTERMQNELNLTKKQNKQIYKFFKKDAKYRQELILNKIEEGEMPPMPPMGGGPGGGMPGGGGFSGGGPGGGPGGFSGGFPGGGMPGGFPGGPGMGPSDGSGKDTFVTPEYLEKQESKLKKILTPEQYAKWRSKHPIERLDLNDLGGDRPQRSEGQRPDRGSEGQRPENGQRPPVQQ